MRVARCSDNQGHSDKLYTKAKQEQGTEPEAGT